MENHPLSIRGAERLLILSCSVIINLLVLISCTEPPSEEKSDFLEIRGETQGTTYQIIIAEKNVNLNKKEIDSLLYTFDISLSTYFETSVISKLNKSKSLDISDPSGYFKECFEDAQFVHDLTGGLFDPTVYPLVEGWGFMRNMETPLNDKTVDSLLQFVSFKKDSLFQIKFDGEIIEISKKSNQLKLDFNAIAQGLSVDVLDRYLAKKGFQNYFVEIGGEMILRGHNRENEKWKIGIDLPVPGEKERTLENIINISNKAVATSGNYRKFYIKDGKKFAHTLNPKTGFPVQHSLLSVTVVTDKCSFADAFATAFMAMGKDMTLQFVESHPELDIDVYLLFQNESGNLERSMSKNFKKYLDN